MPRDAPPDLQAWVERHGGYWNIPWKEWDAQNAEYQEALRAEMRSDKEGKPPDGAIIHRP
jgi:hypothetical protein